MSTQGNVTKLVNELSPDPIVAETVATTVGPGKILATKPHGGALNVDNGPDLPGGTQTGTVASGAGNTVIKASGGRLCSVLITTVGSGTGNVVIYDNATTNSGTIIAQFSNTTAANTVIVFNMPAANGITVANVASGPVLTISFS